MLASVEVGKMFNARVVDLKAQQLTLRVGNQLLDAQLATDLRTLRHRFDRQGPFPATFQVLQTEPQLVLRLATDKVSAENPAMKFVRQSLPYQRSLVELVKFLAKSGDLAGGVNNSRHTSPGVQELSTLAREISQRIATVSTLSTADGVATTLSRSGILYESHINRWMTQKSGLPNKDFKWQLLRAASLIQNTLEAGSQPQSLIDKLRNFDTQIEGSLARIETLQLASHQSSNEESVRLFFEIPLNHQQKFHRVHGYLEQTGKRRNEHPDIETSITLEIEISAQRSILARLTRSSLGLDINLWSEDPTLQQGILSRTANLEKSLENKNTPPARVKLARFDTSAIDPLKVFDKLISDEA